MSTRKIWMIRIIGGLVAVVAIFATLHFTERYWMNDTGGLTRDQVEALSTEEQYALLIERFATMQELLEEAQLQVHDGEWNVHDYGRVSAGHFAPQTLKGATSKNSYFLQSSRGWVPAGAKGDREDLAPFEAYFEEKGWDYWVGRYDFPDGPQHMIRADVGDGWMVWYTVRSGGQYNVEVLSGPFWADTLELKIAFHNRRVDLGPDVAVPSVKPPIPAWDGPLLPPEERISLR